jgi:Family of unknown function (DUF5995)
MPPTTIDSVISVMDGIIERAWNEKSRIGYFAALYRRVTHAVRDGMRSGNFQNGPLMEQLDVVFASRYLDALSAYQSGGTASRSWKLTFDACGDESRLILQHLLAGMNAHINLDLGVASAQVSPGAQLPELETDFNQINDILAAQVGAVESEMSALSPLIENLSAVGLSSETTLINFNIGLARKASWFTAQRLANEPSFLHEITIDGLDLAVSVGGRTILYPPLKGDAVAAIRTAEVQDVRSVIDILAGRLTGTAPTATAN